MKKIYFYLSLALVWCCFLNAAVAQEEEPTECEGVVAYHQIVGSSGWNGGVTEITVDAGQSIDFGPQPNAGFTWTWTGPNGFTANSRNPRVSSFTQDMAGEYIATVTGAECSSTITYTVSVNAPPDPADATLTGITVNGIAVEDFDPATMTYNVTVASSPAIIVATPTNPNATIEQAPAGEVDLNEETPTAITLTVTPEDGESPAEIYTLNVTLCEPTAIVHNYQTDGGDWAEGNFVSVDPGQTVVLGPGPDVENTEWSWTGPNGFVAETREITLADIEAADVGNYVATYTNECGTESTATFTLSVNAEPNGKTIVFATPTAEDGTTKDDAQINWLRANGFTVNIFYNADITLESTEQIDMLNNADLIIIGRGGSSGGFPVAVWNTITTPVILNHQWATRNNLLGFFDFTGGLTNNNTIGETVVADVLEEEDIVFFDAELEEGNTLPWSISPDDYVNAPTAATNGTVLAQVSADATTAAGAYLFVRFDANEPFYTGGGTPAGERTYFGFGNDAAGVVNFFPLTAQAKQVYLNEIMRLTGISFGPLSQATSPAPADNATGQDPVETTISWEGNGETFSLYTGTTTGNLTLVEDGLTSTTYTLTDLDPSTEYFWRVDSHNGNRTEAGTEWSFTTAAGSGPLAKVSNMTPANNSMVEAEGLTLTWEGNADSYKIYMGTSSNNLSLVEDGITETSYTPENIQVDRLYYWRVDAVRGENEIRGDVSNFTTVAATGIAGLAAQGVDIYPNPVNGSASLNLNNAEELVTVNVYSAQGVLVRTIKADSNGTISIPVSDLANGLYMLKAVKKDRTVLSGKFVK